MLEIISCKEISEATDEDLDTLRRNGYEPKVCKADCVYNNGGPCPAASGCAGYEEEADAEII